MNISSKDTARLAALFDVVADLIAERCVARLQAVSVGRGEYTSKSPPPGMSRRGFHDRCKQLAGRGDTRVCKRGRQWVASRDAIDETPPRRRASTQKPVGEWSAEGALAAAGVRAQRESY